MDRDEDVRGRRRLYNLLVKGERSNEDNAIRFVVLSICPVHRLMRFVKNTRASRHDLV